MDLCQQELERLVLDNDNCEGDGNSDSDATIEAHRPLSVRSDPFDEELPKNFNPRKPEWFFNPRPDPRKPISMFWTDHKGFYAIPSPEPVSAESRGQPKEKLGTMGLLEQLFVPRREENTSLPKWTIGAPLPNLSLRRVSVDANDLSHLSLARPPTPPRRRSHYQRTMSNKPLPPLPRPRRFMSVGDQSLFSRARSQSTPGEFTLGMGNPSQSDSTTEGEVESIVNAYQDTTTPAATSQESTANGENSRENEHHVAGPYLLHRLHQYQDNQMTAIAQMEAALANPHVNQSLRSKFLSWSQQLLDLNFPFRVSANPAYGEQIKITEKDAHTVVDWAIMVGTKMNGTLDHIIECLNAGDLVQAQLRSMCAGVDIYRDPPVPLEELYHKMTEVVQKRCRSPRAHEVNLLICFLHLFERLLYNPFQLVMDRVVVVRNERPHDPMPNPLNIATPLSSLKRVLDTAFGSYNEYTSMTRQIRGEFFVPIEKRIPGVSSRTQGYLNNVVGPSNVI
ncbi:hypothetical protein UA08_03021 [Talaromyces atroroseus]|uniref:Uncharacterized protein n=1 Tax=Talaromyces atroroseus TaxID=1441469 RepID=A0A225AJW4_TALAT|nr:hypothetical protein UA08_03021 [Talaromyces atroroseus]OKL61821.1 hypothetical protein UA08_03021 [Talaromyces atroroseus]